MIGRLRRAALVALGLVIAFAERAPAQLGYFGRNKIQYRAFDWHVLKGPHVDLYYYPAEERIARVALSYAEQSYDTLALFFNHRPTRRIPLIIYASHTDFEQTNVLPFVPPEGVLGVTEYMKRRVTIPFRGNYSEFRHTLRHELVHVFQLSIETQNFNLYPRGRRPVLPLWFTEGLAEHWSSPQDSRDEMLVRDLVLGGNMPSIEQLDRIYSAIVYPLGGELHAFLARKYGDWRVAQLYKTFWKYGSFEDAVAAVYGRDVRRLTEEWHYDLRQRYFPAVADRRPVGVAGREIAELAIKPVAVVHDSTVDVAYISPKTGYTNIYVKPLDGGKAHVAVAGERTPEFESFHEYQSRMDARNGVLVFGAKFGDRDALFFWDTKKEKVVGRYQFDSIVSVLSPAWSPDGHRVAFSGLSMGGVSDLYLLDTRTGTLSRITDDIYEDNDPTWLPDGHTLVFSSDRAFGGDEGAHNLFRIDIAGGRAQPLTAGNWLDETPRWDPRRGRIIFSSDRDGTFNLFSVDSLGVTRRETRFDGGIFDPAPVVADGRVVVTAFANLTWALYTIVPDSTIPGADSITTVAANTPSETWTWSGLDDPRVARAEPRRYHRDFTLDFAAGGSSNQPGYGSAQAGQLYFSDVLGDHLLFTSVAFYGNGSGGIKGTNVNADIFYLNQRRRLNWGLGAFRVGGTFVDVNYERQYRETSSGGYGLIRYPMTRFTRVEAQARLEYSNRDDYANDLVRGARHRRGILSSNVLSLTHDNTLWLDTGPIDGTRFNVSAGVVSDMTHGIFEEWLGVVDYRRYLRVSQQSAFAFREFGFVSEGTRPRAITVGGPWLLRGYPGYSLGGTRAWVSNNEYRFPIANFVALGFPFGVIRFPQVQGAFFVDAGQAWYREQYDQRVLGAAGASVRMALLPGIVVRGDFGKRFVLNGRLNDSSPRFTDIFIGYNY